MPEAVAWHVRGWAGGRPPPPRTLPLEARLHSFKNHYLLLLKNEDVGNLLRRFPAVLGWDLRHQGHALLRNRAQCRTYAEHDLRGNAPVSVQQLPGAALLFWTSILRHVGEWDAVTPAGSKTEYGEAVERCHAGELIQFVDAGMGASG